MKTLSAAVRRGYLAPQAEFTAAEAAIYLQMRPARILAAIKSGELPSVRFGRRHTITRSACDAWLAKLSADPKPPIDRERLDDLMAVLEKQFREAFTANRSNDHRYCAGWTSVTSGVFERPSDTLYTHGYIKQHYGADFPLTIPISAILKRRRKRAHSGVALACPIDSPNPTTSN